MSEHDPTEDTLATIASILEHTEHHEPGQSAPDEQPLAPEPTDADGYTKFGPGPMAAIRFKWAVQRGEDGQYYVHETIGEHSAPVVNGPMTGEEAIRLVDERESDARQRFEALRSEIAGRGAVAELVRRSEGDF